MLHCQDFFLAPKKLNTAERNVELGVQLITEVPVGPLCCDWLRFKRKRQHRKRTDEDG